MHNIKIFTPHFCGVNIWLNVNWKYLLIYFRRFSMIHVIYGQNDIKSWMENNGDFGK